MAAWSTLGTTCFHDPPRPATNHSRYRRSILGLILLDRLVVTGFAAMGFREAAAAYGVPILQKPFDVQALATSVREALSQGPRRIRPDRGTGPPSTMSLVEAANTLRKSASASC